MEINYIKTHMIIERYVKGTLSQQEETDFEERLVWDQALQEEVELAETLHKWLHASATPTEYQVNDDDHSLGWSSRFNILTGVAARTMLQPAYAAAASFVLGIFITFSALQNVENDLEFGLDQSVPSLVVPLISTRSANNDLQEVPASPGAVTLLLIDVPDPTQQFDVVVRNSEGNIAWQQASLFAGYLDAVAVGVPGSVLPPGDYTLMIESAITGSSYKQEFGFTSVSVE